VRTQQLPGRRFGARERSGSPPGQELLGVNHLPCALRLGVAPPRWSAPEAACSTKTRVGGDPLGSAPAGRGADNEGANRARFRKKHPLKRVAFSVKSSICPRPFACPRSAASEGSNVAASRWSALAAYRRGPVSQFPRFAVAPRAEQRNHGARRRRGPTASGQTLTTPSLRSRRRITMPPLKAGDT
jgi:hypothetical protein